MDSSLNLAHRCHRKADYYISCNRFQEAINYHLKAADYLTEALIDTSCDTMKSSLEVQKEYHLSQESLLKRREKSESQNRQTIINRDLFNKQLVNDKFNASNKLNSFDTNNIEVDANGKTVKNKLQFEIYRVMDEHDSLLQFLINKKTDTNIDENSQASPALSKNNGSNESIYKSGVKVPKDDKTKIEELQTVNEKLRQLVFQLLDQLEDSQKQINRLEKENIKLKQDKDNNRYSSLLPDLPPLEPPALLY